MAWEMFDRDGAGGFQICGVDGDALDQAPVAGLPVGCEITIDADSAAPAALGSTEDELERVTASLKGRIVATSRARTTLVTLAYLPSDDGADRYSKVSLPRSASISVAPAIDPGWTLFDRARPAAMEEQSMLDFRVRSQLFAAGDIGGQRRIEHVVTGVRDEQIGEFTTAVETGGVEVAGAELGQIAIVQQADPKEVTESSWTIRLIAERFAANYDGWSCELVRGPEPEQKKRRWFR